MITRVYNSYEEFERRLDRKENGLLLSLAIKFNYNIDSVIESSNEGCWNCIDCSECRRCAGCHGCSKCANCVDLRNCKHCVGCSNSKDLVSCSNCSYCLDSRMLRLSYMCCSLFDKQEYEWRYFDTDVRAVTPRLENIHEKIYQAIKSPGNQLNMDDWHTCETTHCYAGWAIHLSGEQGRMCEDLFGTGAAAMFILNWSSPRFKTSPNIFFADEKDAIEHISRMAMIEKNNKR